MGTCTSDRSTPILRCSTESQARSASCAKGEGVQLGTYDGEGQGHGTEAPPRPPVSSPETTKDGRPHCTVLSGKVAGWSHPEARYPKDLLVESVGFPTMGSVRQSQ